MYKRLSEKETKSYYRFVLSDTISIVEKQLSVTPIGLYKDIHSQLIDLRENVVEKQIYKNDDDINDHYSLGSIAIKDFAANSEMQLRLIDIFGGAFDYADFPE